jgi:predicted membrane channel-forming protein YqfA (hemolysin III family)
MKPHKKTLIASVITFIVGTSCCWMSAIAIWLGGASFLGILINIIEDFQVLSIILSIALGIISIYLFRKQT